MQFPPSIDLCRSGYSRNLKGEQAPQTFDAWQRQRRKVRKRGVIDTVCWVVNQAQCQQIEQFHRQASGQYFAINLPAYNGIIKTSARFDSPLMIRPVGDFFEITASFYIPQPFIMSSDQLDNALLAGIGITDHTFGDAWNDWVNVDWAILWNTGITHDFYHLPLHEFVNEKWALLLTGVRNEH